MGSVSNGLVTDTRWKCFSLPKEMRLNDLSWVTSRFDDTDWGHAVVNFSNRVESSPWGKVPNISEESFWISTAAKSISRLFCRRKLSEVSLKRTANGMFSAL